MRLARGQGGRGPRAADGAEKGLGFRESGDLGGPWCRGRGENRRSARLFGWNCFLWGAKGHQIKMRDATIAVYEGSGRPQSQGED